MEMDFNQNRLTSITDLKSVSDAAYKDGLKKGLMKVAKAMKQKDYSIQLIIEYTGLNEGEIERL
jgi:hypothetical protein